MMRSPIRHVANFQSGFNRPLDEINAKLDQLTQQLGILEESMITDIRLIFNLLQQSLSTSKENTNLDTMSSILLNQQQQQKQFYFNQPQPTTTTSVVISLTDPGRSPALTQRSASEPQPITSISSNAQHFQHLQQQPAADTLGCINYNQFYNHGIVQPSTSHGFFK
jgi:hypothetical protein